MRCRDRGKGRCSVLVAHPCNVKASRLWSEVVAALACCGIVFAIGALIARGM